MTLPPEVQLQLLRIVQEALSNIRKYANATCVWVDWRLDRQWLILRIADDGRGFDPAEAVAKATAIGLCGSE